MPTTVVTTLLIAVVLAVQGIPVLPNQGGTVTGRLTTADGQPAAGVRVAAVARPDIADVTAIAEAMASLAETDQAGQYRLENVPPGRYSIAAGRVDLQTFYPGVLELPGAAAIQVRSGVVLQGIDFALRNESSGRSQGNFFSSGPAGAAVSLKVSTDGGARVPLFSSRGFPRLVLRRTGDNTQTRVSLDQTSIGLAGPPMNGTGSEYDVSIENLPDGYAVKTITYGSADLMKGPLKIPAANFGALTSFTLGQQVTLQMQGGSVYVILGGNITSTVPTPPPPPVQLSQSSPTPPGTISVVLTAVPSTTQATPGVRVSGRGNIATGPRSIYMSGAPGTLYADGTFEFDGVSAGRQVVITGDNPRASRPLAAIVIVGARNVEGLQLEEAPVLPPDFQSQSSPVSDTRAPGTILRLASVRGRVIEESTRQGIPEGIVYFSGQERISFRLQSDGSFEIPHLIPGSYKLEIQVFGHSNVSEAVNVGEDDVNLELSATLVN